MKKVLFCLGVLRIVANTDAMLNVWSVSRDQKQAKMEQSGGAIRGATNSHSRFCFACDK